MARYYVLSVEPTLFAEWSLVRRWGRIGGAERTRIELHSSPVTGDPTVSFYSQPQKMITNATRL
jgi:predicted DNA-binding WGR domain protein